MPVIKVWCLPKLAEEKLKELFEAIVGAVEGVSELELKGCRSVTILFPTDAMEFGLGEEIIVEVTGLFAKPERNDGVRLRLAKALWGVVQKFFPEAMVECFVFPFDPSQGFYSTPRMGLRHKPTAEELEKIGLVGE